MIDQFDDHQAMRGFSPATRERRRWTLTTFTREVDLLSASSADVEAFVGRMPAPASRRAVLSDLRQFFHWAIAHNLADDDPTKGLASIKVPTRHARPLSTVDLARAIAASRTGLRVAIMLGAYAGLRVSEIASIEWRDVHADRGVLVVRDGKGGKDRKVPLARELADALDQLARRPDGRVIGTTGSNVSQRIRQHFRRLDIDHRPHDTRATFGTQVASKYDIVTAQRLLGHTSVATTQAYLGWTPDASDALDGLYDDAA